MSKSLLLVGNGFNQCLEVYLKSLQNDKRENYENILEKIRLIIDLWRKFSHLIENEELKNNLRDIFKVEVERINSIEEIINYIYISIDFLRLTSRLITMGKPKNEEECLYKLSENIKENIYSKLSDLAIDFWDQEIDGFYSSLENVKSELCSKSEIGKFTESIRNIYTTNYDGIVDTIFNFNQSNEYSFTDYFRRKNKYASLYSENIEYISFCPESIEYNSENKKLLHLHGSYKFFRFFINEEQEEDIMKIKIYKKNIDSETAKMKLKKFIKENELVPVIVLDAKIKKKEIIENNAVLREYFRLFQNDLKTAKNLIIWGISLTNDSHIENAIEYYFLKENKSRDKKIIIVDINTNHKIIDTVKDTVKIEHINPNKYESFCDLLEGIIQKLEN